MASTSQFIVTLFIFIECINLGYILLSRALIPKKRRWLQGIALLVITITALQYLPEDWMLLDAISREALIWVSLIALATVYGGAVISDLVRDHQRSTYYRGLGVLAVVWGGSFMITAALTTPAFTGWAEWRTSVAILPATAGALGGVIYSLFILILATNVVRTAPMPEIANRGAFWVVTTTVMLIAVTLLASGSAAFMLPGTVVLLSGLILVTYGMRHYRLGSVRETLLKTSRTAAFVSIAWVLIFGTLYILGRFSVLEQLDLAHNPESTLAVAAIALGIAVLMIPPRQLFEYSVQQLLSRSRPNLAHATAQYSEHVANAASLDEVVRASTKVVSQVLKIQRSAIILINATHQRPDSVQFIVLESGATVENPTTTGYISKYGAVFQTLAVTKVPLGQYDIDYGPAYQDIPEDECAFLRSLEMSIYVPVISDDRLIGLLGTGRKSNDASYSREDIEVLSVISQQISTALRSARLIDDLQHLNDTMRVLNKRLEGAKGELEKLDSIKTDFITIASHELRTPLAQIRGYTDIIDSLNDSDALQKDQTTKIITNLRKSTERMEELISAMLDVSQIDVNSLDLRFVRTTPDVVIKMALDPLRDPASERNITIEWHGLGGLLPHIEVDLQRMTQAFRNLILNAIKFTPDGGRIDIHGDHIEASDGNALDTLLFRIEDSGVGIAEKDREYIFEKFYRGYDTQLHSTGIYKFMGAGPGLGLTIAKGIIEGHGGKIWVESPGHDLEAYPGSIFFVQLPLSPPEGTSRVVTIAERSQIEDELAKAQNNANQQSERGEASNTQNTRIPRSR